MTHRPATEGTIAGEQFFFDRDGQPMDVMAWGRAYGDFAGRLVASTDVKGVTVVTVWVGTNEDLDDVPLIYGTHVMGAPDNGRFTIRTSSQGEAEIAHRVMVDRIASGLGGLPRQEGPR